MQKILFRGKPVSQVDYSFFEATFPNSCINDGFVTGSLLIDEDDNERCYIAATVLATLNCTVNNTQLSSIRVVPATIGQFIGLRDKNQKRVFEKDILLDTESGYTYQVKYFEEFARYGLANRAGSIEIDEIEEFINDMVVVGNVIDTPEKLK